jgi:hypothetical protein
MMQSNALNNESRPPGYGGGVATTSGLHLTLDEIEAVTVLDTVTMTPTTVSVQIHNTGMAWTSEGGAPLRIVAVWDGEVGLGTPAGEATVAALNSGEMQEVSVPLTAPPGGLDETHTLRITANPGQLIAEQRAEDNQHWRRWTARSDW